MCSLFILDILCVHDQLPSHPPCLNLHDEIAHVPIGGGGRVHCRRRDEPSYCREDYARMCGMECVPQCDEPGLT